MEDGCGPSWSPDTNRSQNTEQDDELTIPRAAMNKMIKEILPNIRVANEARELVLSCCTEFIHLVSSESNEVCNQQQKKTISADHVLSALNRLGFGDFVKEAEEVLSECKESAAKRRRQSTRLENLGILRRSFCVSSRSCSPEPGKLPSCRSSNSWLRWRLKVLQYPPPSPSQSTKSIPSCVILSGVLQFYILQYSFMPCVA